MSLLRVAVSICLAISVVVTKSAAQPTGPIPQPRLGMPLPKELPRRQKPVAKNNEPAASVEGDVYVVTRGGDTKRGAGQTVYLLIDEPSMRDSLAQRCRQYELTASAVGKAIVANKTDLSKLLGSSTVAGQADALLHRHEALQQEAAYNRIQLVVSVRDFLKDRPVDEVGTGPNGHYRFEMLRPGRYVLFSEWSIGDEPHQWWAPVALTGGKPLARDLDGSVDADPSSFCSRSYFGGE